MFFVLHPQFSRQQVSASWEFLLGREKTSLLYFFTRDAIDPELNYNKNRKKTPGKCRQNRRKIWKKSFCERRTNFTVEKSENLVTRTENFGFRIDATLNEKWSSSQHRRLSSSSRRILGFFITFSPQTMPTRVVVGEPRLSSSEKEAG